MTAAAIATTETVEAARITAPVVPAASTRKTAVPVPRSFAD